MITENDFSFVELGINLLLIILVENEDKNERIKAAKLVKEGMEILKSSL